MTNMYFSLTFIKQDSFAMLNRHELPSVAEEAERCDSLRYVWEKLNLQALTVQDNLLELQPTFRETLAVEVKEFIENCDNFYQNYDQVIFLKLNLFKT